MLSQMKLLYGTSFDEYFKDYIDPRTVHLPLLSSPIPVLIITTCYVIFVKFIGPKLMENRKPYDLKNIIIVYNLFHFISSGFFFYAAGHYGWFYYNNFFCTPNNLTTSYHNEMFIKLGWWFFMSKFFEFCDTIFFILRKKNNQVSTLHVVHHALVPIIGWLDLKFCPVGHYTFKGFVNTFVHTVMYFYYMLSALGPKYRKFLWWKKYVTILQLAQFVIVLYHSLQTLIYDCPVSKFLGYVTIFQAILFFGLFMNFYILEYKKRNIEKKQH